MLPTCAQEELFWLTLVRFSSVGSAPATKTEPSVQLGSSPLSCLRSVFIISDTVIDLFYLLTLVALKESFHHNRLIVLLITMMIVLPVQDENKEIALGTSKLNYLDPRITVAWYVSSAVCVFLCLLKLGGLMTVYICCLSFPVQVALLYEFYL